MRVLHISTRLILGGSQENTVLSCEGQARLGHEVHLAFGPIYGPEGSLLERVQRFRTVDGRRVVTHELPSLVRELSPLKDRMALSDIRNLVRDIAPDIVHTHSSKAGVLGRVAAWRFRKPAAIAPEAWTEWTRPDGNTTRIFVGERVKPPANARRTSFVRASVQRDGLGIVHTIHGPPFHAFEKKWRNALYIASEKFAAKRCHVIVSVCDAMTTQFRDAGIGRPEQYVTVYSGMEVEPFLTPASPGDTREAVRASLGLGPGEIVIGTVARLAELKGHDDVLDALAPDLRANAVLKLLWVGDGWWRQRLEAKIASMNLAGRVILTGLVPPERVPGLMRAMDLLVHPSYREGLPRTVPQALLAGTPVVASDVDGTREACFDRETGRLYPVGDAAALRGAVRWMLDDPARAKATAEAGRELCRERFDARTMVRDLEAVYARALAEARG